MKDAEQWYEELCARTYTKDWKENDRYSLIQFFKLIQKDALGMGETGIHKGPWEKGIQRK